ncbi:MAG: hypothetical protein QF415_10785 [Candidatus Undinarchaeales archaeon]|jgi:hypothetical protein|nr:hypothetical protein [Candidatus Undinarchaeales archaeon]MDP7491585.1 hypothetical protein [Candidatus Undinarchaeales archaeon]
MSSSEDITWDGESLVTATIGEGYEAEKITGDCDFVIQELINDDRSLRELYINWSWTKKEKEYSGFAVIEPEGDVEFWDSRLKAIGEKDHLDIHHKVEGYIHSVNVVLDKETKAFANLSEAIAFAKEHKKEFDEIDFDIILPSIPLPGKTKISPRREEVLVHLPAVEDHLHEHEKHKERVELI